MSSNAKTGARVPIPERQRRISEGLRLAWKRRKQGTKQERATNGDQQGSKPRTPAR